MTKGSPRLRRAGHNLILTTTAVLAACTTTYHTPSGKPEATFIASQANVTAAADEWAKSKLWALRDRHNGRITYWSQGQQPLEGLDTMLFGGRLAYEVILDLRDEGEATTVSCTLIIHHRDSDGPKDLTNKPAGASFCGGLESISAFLK